MWQVVKDHGPITPSDVANRLCEDLVRVRQTISNLGAIGMLQSGGRRGRGAQSLYEAVGATYDEALRYRPVPIKVPAPTAPAAEPKMVLVANPARGAFGLPPALEDMTLRELKEVRDKLNALFK